MFIVVRFSAMIRVCTALIAVSLALSIMGAVRRDDGEPAAAVSAPAAGPVLVIDPGHGGLDGGAVGAVDCYAGHRHRRAGGFRR